MTWDIFLPPNEKRRLVPPFLESYQGLRLLGIGRPLAQRGEGLLCVLHQRVLRLALDEILEGRGGLCPLAQRRTGQRASEHGIGGKGAARVVLEERLERLGRVGVT